MRRVWTKVLRPSYPQGPGTRSRAVWVVRSVKLIRFLSRFGAPPSQAKPCQGECQCAGCSVRPRSAVGTARMRASARFSCPNGAGTIMQNPSSASQPAHGSRLGGARGHCSRSSLLRNPNVCLSEGSWLKLPGVGKLTARGRESSVSRHKDELPREVDETGARAVPDPADVVVRDARLAHCRPELAHRAV
jgi:hypothetical protein